MNSLDRYIQETYTYEFENLKEHPNYNNFRIAVEQSCGYSAWRINEFIKGKLEFLRLLYVRHIQK